MTYTPQPTPAFSTGATSVRPRSAPAPRLDDVRGGFEATFGGYTPADWTLDAECTAPGVDPAVFHPGQGGNSSKAALAICGRCEVRETCLEDALTWESSDAISGDDPRPEPHGVRGGLTAPQRLPIVQERKAARHAAERAAVLEDYAAGELSRDEIAAKHNVAEASVTRWANEAGLEPKQVVRKVKAGDSQAAILGYGRRKGETTGRRAS